MAIQPSWFSAAPYLAGWAAAAFAAWVMVVVVLVSWGRRQRARGEVDLVVVPGCKVYADGRPSPALQRRVLSGAREAMARGIPLVISGAAGEAEVGAALALRHGVPPERVLVEPTATNTAENAARTAALMGDVRVLVVSDDYHLLRCGWLFRRHFRQVELSAALPGPWPWRPASRELFGLLRALTRA